MYACGQFYPKMNILDFTLSDQGEGIREKVSNFLNKSISSTEAIQWAMVDGNTTKKNIPGGYGLAILRSLCIEKNYVLLTNDADFKNTNAEVLSLNDAFFTY